MNAKNIAEMVQADLICDIIILLDATSSMQPFITETQKAIKQVINEVTTKVKYYTPRISLICFRDFKDNPQFDTH